jgi:hypothetical protein
VVVAAIALWMGKPEQTPDDLFFVGAPINLAQGGAYENPLAAGWMAPFHTTSFFVQPPLYTFVLAGWLKLLGISTLTLLGFQWACAVIATWSLDRVLDRCGALPLTRAVMAGFLFWIQLGRGLRYEPLAVALIWSGLAVFRYSKLRGGLGLFLVASGVQAVPWLGPMALTFQLAVHPVDWQAARASPRSVLQGIAVLTIAALASALLFAVAIDGAFGEFWRVLSEHQNAHGDAAVGDPSRQLGHLWVLLAGGWRWLTVLPAFAVWIVCGLSLLRRLPSPPARLAAASLATAVMSLLFYAVRAMHYVAVLEWLTICLWLQAGPRQTRTYVAAALLLAGSQSGAIISIARHALTPSFDYAAVRREVELRDPAAPLFVDTYAARFVFDYKLPPGTRAWEFSDPLPKTFPRSLAEHQPGTVWVIRRVQEQLWQNGVPVTILGRTFRSIQYPDPTIIVLK